MAIVKVVTPDLSLKELQEFVGVIKADISQDKKDSKEEPDSGGEAYNWNDLLEMEYKTLKKFVKENDLTTDPADFSKSEVEDFRKKIAEEIDVKIPKEEKTSDPEAQDDNYTWKDLTELDYDELEELVEEQKLDTDPDDFEEAEEDKFRRAIAKELKIEVPKKKKK